MYSSSRGGSAAYGGGQQQQQQPYTSQSAYSQNLGTPYSVGGADGGSQLSLASRHSSMLGGPKESDITGYRGHPSAGAHYGGQYTSVYGSAALGSGQKIPGMSGKGAASAALEGRTGYGSTIPDSPKFTSGDYVSSSSHGYGQKNDPLLSDKTYDHPSMDRRQYGERQSAYVGRDLQNVPTSRYGDSISFGRQHQPDMYDRMDQTSLLRQEQLLKAQSLQSASIDGGSRQADYLATRGSSIHHSAQELMSYGGRTDADPRSLSYGAQPAPSILGAAPQRNMDDLIYGQNSSNPGYGVSLPPGRDYATGKGLHGVSLDSDYPGSLLSRGAYPRIDELKDDRIGYSRELDRREEERRRDLLREREKERDREKARERERERERDRDRERKRERERERERLERREKERERDRARGLEARRERSLSRISKDRAERGGSSLTKDIRPTRLDSPRHEASHRRPSPVREKRREYVCKVYSSNLVEIERDYLSLDKRYPRLFISPQCSKVVVNWPKENLRLSIHTPVSFEHGFVGENTGPEQKEPPSIPSANEPLKSESRTIVWNAKMILMSGLSQNALEELSSERSYDDRVPHYCNMLRFAVLKKDNALMAIGGPWDTVDGGDPSVDDSSLVQTVLRYAKDVTQLDLKNCKHWNRFLEIHYDRVGKDGLFSHKEVTVLFVPDLSDCLPSLEAWRDQWIAHMKAIAERASQLAQKKEKSKEKKGGMKDKEIDSRNKEKGNGKSEKIAESASSGQAVDINNTEKDDHEQKAKAAVKEGDKNEKLEKIDGTKASGGTDVQKEDGGSVGVQVAGSGKTGKKKIIKKVIKQKVTDKKEVLEDSTKVSDKVDEKNVGENKVNSENSAPQNEPSASAAGVKTFVRKKVVKKVPVAKVVLNESPGTQTQLKTEGTEDKADSGADLLVQDATTKKVAKKKIIKRVPKRKVTPVEAKNVVGNTTKDDEKEEVKTGQAGSEAKFVAKLEENITSKSVTPEKSGNSSVTQSKVEKEDKVDERRDNEKIGKGEKSTEKEKSKDDEKKDKKGRDESKSKPNKEVKEKKKPEEPPRHPGLFLQTKRGKDSKLRSVSLSLDSLLDYTDKDIDESTYELSLFAESLHEMLQYQMGSRLLTFLQKLRLKFVMKRNQRKRQRDEISKDSDKKSSTKRLKTDKATAEDKSTKTETDDAARADDGKAIVKEEGNVKQEDGTDVDDPEEDPDEDEEMLDESSQQDLANEENAAGEKIHAVIKSKEEVENSDDKKQETLKENADSKPKTGSTSNENEEKTGTKTKETEVVDKELLQAFRFFDRNRVGYIRVEDMRLIIHNLGKFLSHRDVKELVQSALLESNTGRDDRILYPKLVRMAYV